MDMNPVAAKHFDTGQRVLNMGKSKEAIPLFLLARAKNGATTAELEQQLGICHRLVGSYEQSKAAFDNALRLSETALHEAQIVRDQGMLFLQKGSYETALKNFQRSCTLLQGILEEITDDKKTSVRIEYFVSNGFIGRAHLLMGHYGTARGYFRVANMVLYDHAPYELNNLVWLMKATPLFARLKLACRAWRLAWQSRNKKRQIQIALLVISPWLERRIG